MIFTLGKRSIYEPLFGGPEPPCMARHSSVWETAEAAAAHIAGFDYEPEFAVYGVLADWDDDTYEGDYPDCEWRCLGQSMPLVKLDGG
jgi:hypothetical protein